MNIIPRSEYYGEDPTPADLAAIEAEWPQIAAELDVLDAEIAELTNSPYMSELDRRRVRRAERRVLDAHREPTVTPNSKDAA
ncbi:hypothetical protein HPO96_17440 [Kribbella sandramycini]|uniref:Cob(I)alamin adenosyltransferase n=1 Tax=Kribbella sandramycini TaxID=60450 RepID=A0A7Y4NZH0_9ACTN|nr:cob(I)alamin adenosyltransferase [Kribbella sandramycini]NOL42032.1 hypothetical protein [Kribbella sandramycini]